MRRLMLAMSQEKLGAALGLTFQQVQKYEKGTNRIGASRLQQISDILQVPVAFFFEGAPKVSAPRGFSGSTLSMADIDDFISDSDGLRLMGAFMRIDNAAVRRRIVMLVQEIAGGRRQLECLTRTVRGGRCWRQSSNRSSFLIGDLLIGKLGETVVSVA
jgi:transcriptional regulator with XRE-family HTH domain